MSAFVVPLQPTPQSLTVSLAGAVYKLIVKWNDENQSWVLDIYDATNTPVVLGIPIVTGLDLLSPFEYLGIKGQLIAQTTNDTFAVPTFQNLGDLGNLYFIPDSGATA